MSSGKAGDAQVAGESPVVDRAVVKPQRLVSIDAYRGVVMFLMLAEVLELKSLAKHFPGNSFFEWVRFHTSHVPWVGCSVHDMIQPSFSFLVGVAMPFSLASRAKRGDSKRSMAGHAAWRAVVLILLGIVLRSLGRSQTNFFFVDTLTQIGLGYFALFLLGQASRVVQIVVVSLTLIGYWQLFALWSLPDLAFSSADVGVQADWPHLLSGFEGHWNMNMNPAFYFDTWFMNLFPRPEPYLYDGGGYCVLNFIPTFATMALGVMAGQVLLQGQVAAKKNDASSQVGVRRKGLLLLLAAGAGLAICGWGLGAAGLCPIVKRIWTPSWVLYSGGLCFMALGVLHWVCDILGYRRWAWPVMVIGANSIVAYVMSWTVEKAIRAFLSRHLGEGVFMVAGEVWEPILLGAAVLLCMWLILLWLFKRRIFVRI